MRETYSLHDRVELIGSIPHHQVRENLVRGHIFLSCSLTESFCIALLEATCCGLFVVSTNVGGVPEVLPPSMVKFAEPTVLGLVNALGEAISISRKIIPKQLHERMKLMYSWYDVAARTEIVYYDITNMEVPSLATRILRYKSGGPWSGIITAFMLTFLRLFAVWCEWIWPVRHIEICPDFPWSRKVSLIHPHTSSSSHTHM
jgi:phosphatidylinositol glycan class A protein